VIWSDLIQPLREAGRYILWSWIIDLIFTSYVKLMWKGVKKKYIFEYDWLNIKILKKFLSLYGLSGLLILWLIRVWWISHSAFTSINSFWYRIKKSGIENSDDKAFLKNENKKNIATIQLSEVLDVLALTLLRL